ncbi:MAG: hypothetical protein GW911_23745 [Armatimonadetes bacterium]|nr:hypothetical protein [Armatimonadota bacterium]NCO91427.1 hypothetical protein [Armatimonadota bacterium]NCP31464.1 hypothetical protein [Armatimonadota bacterium]NCQ26691.1 hypothetical protein [Armatimonadota bacterium]NDK15057.1 hypothetical protein [Armatimonadota bacterium]
MAAKTRNQQKRSATRAGARLNGSLAQVANTPATLSTVGPSRCGWCGRRLRALPFQTDSVVLCVDCYGSHHYEDRPGDTVPPDQGEAVAPSEAAPEIAARAENSD